MKETPEIMETRMMEQVEELTEELSQLSVGKSIPVIIQANIAVIVRCMEQLNKQEVDSITANILMTVGAAHKRITQEEGSIAENIKRILN